MSRKMLIEATHPEETRVVVLDEQRLEELDVETSTKKQLKGNIYLAKIVRVEPSLQAAFVDYGGNRHGFLAFNEIHPDYYQIPKKKNPSNRPLRLSKTRKKSLRKSKPSPSRKPTTSIGLAFMRCVNIKFKRSFITIKSSWCKSPKKNAVIKGRL